MTGIKQDKESEELQGEMGRIDFQVVSTDNNKSTNINLAQIILSCLEVLRVCKKHF